MPEYKVNNEWTLEDLGYQQRCHLAWRLDHKTWCGLITASKIARLETCHKDWPIFKVFMECGMTERASKIHACKVINYSLGALVEREVLSA